MGVETGIQWTHHTWNAWRGCAKVSLGCKFCYAETLSRRNPAVLGVWGPNGTRVIAKDWDAPLRYDRATAKAGERRRIFMSLNDWLEDRPELDEPRSRLLELIEKTPNLDWLLLTKRPENFDPLMERIASTILPGGIAATSWLYRAPPPNVWLGVSVEDQETADARIPELLDIPASLRWVSYEPALGPVDFSGYLPRSEGDGNWPSVFNQVEWIVVGGESGKDARPFNIDWARDTIRQCRAAGVPVFVKQLGRRPFNGSAIKAVESLGLNIKPCDLVYRDPKGGDPSEWPEDLRVREMPEGGGA